MYRAKKAGGRRSRSPTEPRRQAADRGGRSASRGGHRARSQSRQAAFPALLRRNQAKAAAVSGPITLIAMYPTGSDILDQYLRF